jgi:hypothetical protein
VTIQEVVDLVKVDARKRSCWEDGEHMAVN